MFHRAYACYEAALILATFKTSSLYSCMPGACRDNKPVVNVVHYTYWETLQKLLELASSI